jgi:transcriptional regulator with XRE-family HTH domain
MHVGHRIRKRREELKLKQAELARLIDVSPSQINRYEKGGRTPEGARLKALARVLKVKPSWLRNED